MVKNIMNKNTEKIDLIKKVYSKTEYPKIINTQFQQLGVISVNEQIELTTTVQQFFEYYNELFYDIPSYGSSNSHEYLIKTSGEYINFDQENEIIVALRAEITQLRKDLLQAEIEKAEAISGEKLNLNVNDGINEQLAGKEQYNIITSAIPADTTGTSTIPDNSNITSGGGNNSGGGY